MKIVLDNSVSFNKFLLYKSFRNVLKIKYTTAHSIKYNIILLYYLPLFNKKHKQKCEIYSSKVSFMRKTFPILEIKK